MKACLNLSMRKYKTVFFDLDNTLWNFNANSIAAMKQVVAGEAINLEGIGFEKYFEVYSRYNEQLWKSYRANQVSKEELTVKRFQQTFDELKISNVNAGKLNDLYLEILARQTKIMPDVVDTLEYLKTKGCSLYIITNGFREAQSKKLVNARIEGYFQKIFVSEEIKSNKPAPEIFEYALKSANASKKSSIMVGDEWETDIAGAVNFGIDAVYVNDKEDDYMVIPENRNRVFCINRLNRLKKVLFNIDINP